MKTLWCKNQENPSDQISHAWAPLMFIPLQRLLSDGFCVGTVRVH